MNKDLISVEWETNVPSYKNMGYHCEYSDCNERMTNGNSITIYGDRLEELIILCDSHYHQAKILGTTQLLVFIIQGWKTIGETGTAKIQYKCN